MQHVAKKQKRHSLETPQTRVQITKDVDPKANVDRFEFTR